MTSMNKDMVRPRPIVGGGEEVTKWIIKADVAGWYIEATLRLKADIANHGLTDGNPIVSS